MKNHIIKKTLKRLFFNKLPESLKRFAISLVYNKENFVLRSSEDVFSDIYNECYWGKGATVSGGGSAMDATVGIRKQLPKIIKNYSIDLMLDIPCGDYHWMKTVEKCNYIGGDIVYEIIENNKKLYADDKVQFKKFDMTTEISPQVDLIFCRDCLQHLSYEKIKKALNNFKLSGSKYLLVTSYPKTWRNHDIYDGDYRPLNLLKSPFYFPKPILKIKENGNRIEIDKTMYLYNLESIPLF